MSVKKSALTLSVCAVLCFSVLSGCENKQVLTAENLKCIHEPEFGGAYVGITIEEFNALGFEFGDSVNLSFSNGYTLDNLPYYNGYYTEPGTPLLVGYPGYDYVKAAVNSGTDLWEDAALTEDCTAKITLAEKGKYLEIQKARDIFYTDTRDNYPSDEVFANFRSVKAGSIAGNTLYRSASPCDNRHNRATYTDALMKRAGVEFVLDLADNDEKIRGYTEKPDFASPYFEELYTSGKVYPIALNMNYYSQSYRTSIADGFIKMSEHEGPYLVHCTEGKDRTGFVCILLEMLMGASYDEIAADYMTTYNNYYGITADTDSAKYNIIVESVFDPMLESIAGDEGADIKTAYLSVYAVRFLKDGGMTDGQIEKLKARLSGAA